jgi:molecular chaperone DnaJ
MQIDLYEILDVSRTASQEEIKRAYRRLARECHPDHHPDDPGMEERFKQVTMAYEILSDSRRREQYDLFGTTKDGPGGFGFDGFGSVSDIFEFFFGSGGHDSPFGSRRARRPDYAEGQDIVRTVTFSLEETLEEQEVSVKIQRWETCPTCKGSRAEPGSHTHTCSQCQGRGVVTSTQRTLLGVFSSAAPCPQCRGTGTIVEEPCKECRGKGQKAEDRTIDLTVPAGVTNGTVMRVPGSGNVGSGGGRSGDILLRVHVKPHPVFTVDGPDLVAELQVSYPELVLGADLSIEHLSGDIIPLKLPPGTQPGEIITVRSRGLPRLNRRGTGDLHLVVKLDVPRKVGRKERELLESLQNHNGKLTGASPRMRKLTKHRER